MQFGLKSTLFLAFDMMLCGTRPPNQNGLNSEVIVLYSLSFTRAKHFNKQTQPPPSRGSAATHQNTYATIQIPYKQRGLYFLFNIFKLYGQILRQISFALVNLFIFNYHEKTFSHPNFTYRSCNVSGAYSNHKQYEVMCCITK